MIIIIKQETIETFKKSWPCNGFPAKIYSIAASWSDDGDFESVDLLSKNGSKIDFANINRDALSALLGRARNNYTTVRTY
jgi:hypothetical protein